MIILWHKTLIYTQDKLYIYIYDSKPNVLSKLPNYCPLPPRPLDRIEGRYSIQGGRYT